MAFLLLPSDLMFQSQAVQVAAAAGVQLKPCLTVKTILSALASEQVAGVLIDLSLPSDLNQLAEACQEAGVSRLIAVGPHVHEDRLEVARNAGWQTFSRGQFHRQGPQILASE